LVSDFGVPRIVTALAHDPDLCVTRSAVYRKYVKGRGSVRQWVKTRDRNEALDLEVYCLAAPYILGPAVIRALPERAVALAVARSNEMHDAVAPHPATPAVSISAGPARRGWVNGWRSLR
jgi:phage terminase large subunit GpA-like protein